MDDHLVCYGCGLIFDAADASWAEHDDDPSAICPDCGSQDIETYETYVEGL